MTSPKDWTHLTGKRVSWKRGSNGEREGIVNRIKTSGKRGVYALIVADIAQNDYGVVVAVRPSLLTVIE